MGKLESNKGLFSEERLTLYRAIELLPDFVVVMDITPPSQGGPYIIYANPAFARVLGYDDMSEIVGRSCWDFISKDNLPRLMQQLRESAEMLHPEEKEMLILRRDGSAVWTEFSGQLIVDDAGNPERWISVGRDIAGRRRETEHHALLMRAIDAIPDAFRLYARENGAFVKVFENDKAADYPEPDERALIATAQSRQATTSCDEALSLIPITDMSGAVVAVACVSS